MLKEGVIKVEEGERKTVEKALFIGEIFYKNGNTNNSEEDYNETINNFISFVKENGFDGSVSNNKNELILDVVYLRWLDLCKNVWILY